MRDGDRPYISAAPEREPTYSERKSEGGFEGTPWSIEQLVEAQRMECAGASDEEIAEAFSCSVSEVRERLAPPEARPPARQERASIGFAGRKRFR